MNTLLKILKDPFSHFIIIGILLFVSYQIITPDEQQLDNQITISEKEVGNIIVNWKKRWNSAPTTAQLTNLIEQQIREEILYREALMLNLQQGDTVIRRRLADKMAFIVNDIVVPTQATDKQLQDFMKKFPDKFLIAERISFKHYYFNPDLYSDKEMQVALLIAKQQLIKGLPVASDDFAGKSEFNLLPEHQIARLFGREFPQKLTSLSVDEWSEPIQSGYGKHLVKISQRSEGALAQLDDIRDYVLQEWRAQQQITANIEVYQSLRSNYEIDIVIPDNLNQLSL